MNKISIFTLLNFNRMPMKMLILLPIFFVVLNINLFAQTNYWEENFNSGQGWTLEENWTVAGGKLEFYWIPSVTNFDLSALSPVITLPVNIAEITIVQYLDVFSGTGNEFAEISIHEGSESTILWNYNLVNGNWGSSGGSDLTFSLAEFGGQDIQIEFRTYGADSYNWNWWDVFEVRLSALFDKDLALTSITGPTSIEVLEQGTWTVEIKNFGMEAQSGYDVKMFCHKTGNMIGSIDVTEVIEPQETKSFSFDWSSNAAYNTAFYGVVELEGDVFGANNISRSQFVRVNPDIEFDILVWDNDNAIQTVTCPEQGDQIEPSTALTRALDVAGYDYTFATTLPDDLNAFEMVFSTMGCYCVD